LLVGSSGFERGKEWAQIIADDSLSAPILASSSSPDDNQYTNIAQILKSPHPYSSGGKAYFQRIRKHPILVSCTASVLRSHKQSESPASSLRNFLTILGWYCFPGSWWHQCDLARGLQGLSLLLFYPLSESRAQRLFTSHQINPKFLTRRDLYLAPDLECIGLNESPSAWEYLAEVRKAAEKT
jgi:hypothetical protein